MNYTFFTSSLQYFIFKRAICRRVPSRYFTSIPKIASAPFADAQTSAQFSAGCPLIFFRTCTTRLLAVNNNFTRDVFFSAIYPPKSPLQTHTTKVCIYRNSQIHSTTQQSGIIVEYMNISLRIKARHNPRFKQKRNVNLAHDFQSSLEAFISHPLSTHMRASHILAVCSITFWHLLGGARYISLWYIGWVSVWLRVSRAPAMCFVRERKRARKYWKYIDIWIYCGMRHNKSSGSRSCKHMCDMTKRDA